MARRRLPPDTRQFFRALHAVIRLNPFSDERSRLLEELTGGHADSAWSLDPDSYELTATVDRLIAALDSQGASTLQDFADEERPYVEAAYLYQEYQRLVPEFDSFIPRHTGDDREPPRVAFARESLDNLLRRGFTREQALFSFAVAFQLRRAFYFIVDSLSGLSDSVRRLREQLWNSVFTFDLWSYQRVLAEHLEDFSTLLLGETGVGKGQAAAAIGRSGFIPFDEHTERFVVNHERTFIAANLSRYPESLIESELFGHRKGAFTGATRDHQGLLERCDVHGALFLDEIGEVGLPVQVKLLEVLQTRLFSPVGGHEQVRFSGRVIAATNQRLEEMRSGGVFRDDFYYRLCSDVIHVPSLRVRLADAPEELPLLVSRIIERITDRENEELASMVVERLQQGVPEDYPWPGNVRELEQAVRGILLTGRYGGNPIAGPPTGSAHALADALHAGTLTGREVMALYCKLLYQRLGSYQAVARQIDLDRRTVRKHVETTSPEAADSTGPEGAAGA